MSSKGSKNINKFSIWNLKYETIYFLIIPALILEQKKLISSCLLPPRQQSGRKNPKEAMAWLGQDICVGRTSAGLGGCVVIERACAGRRQLGLGGVGRRQCEGWVGVDLGCPWRLRGHRVGLCHLPVLAMTVDVIQATYEEYKIRNGWICVEALAIPSSLQISCGNN
jgi:hypothetical protein